MLLIYILIVGFCFASYGKSLGMIRQLHCFILNLINLLKLFPVVIFFTILKSLFKKYCNNTMIFLQFSQYTGGNGTSPVRGVPPAIRSPQNSFPHSATSSVSLQVLHSLAVSKAGYSCCDLFPFF